MIIGGPTVQAVLLTKHFKSTEFETVLLTGHAGIAEEKMDSLVAEYGIKPRRVSYLQREINIIKDLLAFIALWRIFKQHKPHIVHTHTSKAGMLGRLAAKVAGVPVIIHTFHGHVLNHYFGLIKTRVFKFLEKRLASISDAIVAISKRQSADLNTYGIGINKICIIPLGFDFERVNYESKKPSLREKFNINADHKLIGTIGRLVPIKNHSLFIKTAVELLRRRSDLHFMLIGDGEMRCSLEEEVRRSDLVDRVIFTGWLEDIGAVYKNLDMLMLTSLNEGTPLTAIEAMVAGCLVLSTDVGGVSDIIEHQKTGLLALSGDYHALADQVEWAFDHPDEVDRIVEAARAKAVEQYAAKRLFDDLELLYRRLLKEKCPVIFRG